MKRVLWHCSCCKEGREASEMRRFKGEIFLCGDCFKAYEGFCEIFRLENPGIEEFIAAMQAEIASRA